MELDEFSLHVFKFMSIGCGNGIIVVCVRASVVVFARRCWMLEIEDKAGCREKATLR